MPDYVNSIRELVSAFENLEYKDEKELDWLVTRGQMLIRRSVGDPSVYSNDFQRISFHPEWYPYTTVDEEEEWTTGRNRTVNLLNTLIEELELDKALEETEQPAESAVPITEFSESRKVFVVHGHDDAMKLGVARALERLDLEPVILHEQENSGRTIIEKFEHFSDVGFAVVLLSPDDFGYPRDSAPEEGKHRARQNVIFELGFFIGRLGRARAVAIYKSSADLEMPSDYDGVLFIPFEGGRWQFDLIRELKACGYEVDANKLI